MGRCHHQARCQRRDERVSERGSGSERDECVHVRIAMPDCHPGAAIKLRTAIGHDRQRQGQLDNVHSGKFQMRHGNRQQWHGEGDGDGQLPSKVTVFSFVRFFLKILECLHRLRTSSSTP